MNKFEKLLKLGMPVDRLRIGMYRRSEVSGFMPLSCEVLAEEKGGYIVCLEHNYIQNGDLMTDPRMDLNINPETQSVEPVTFEMNGMGIYQEVYSEDGEINTKLFEQLNEFLDDWLDNCIDQGHELKTKEENN